MRERQLPHALTTTDWLSKESSIMANAKDSIAPSASRRNFRKKRSNSWFTSLPKRYQQRSPILPLARYIVMYVRNGREYRSPWFINQSSAQKANALLKARYGRSTIVFD